MTSERINTTSRPAVQARARPPALTRLVARRTVLSSAISAPAARRNWVREIFSASVTPTRGATRSAEAPPVMTAIARSLGPREAINRRISPVTATDSSVGRFSPTGRVGQRLTCCSGASVPAGTLTTPARRWRDRSVVASNCSTPAAIPAAAFPAPTTTMRSIASRCTAGSIAAPANVHACWGSQMSRPSVMSRTGCALRIAADQIASASARTFPIIHHHSP